MTVSLQNNLNELDSLLADLNSAKYRMKSDCRGPDHFPDNEEKERETSNDISLKNSTLQIASIVSKNPKRPPKLMHILKDGEKNRVHDLAKESRDTELFDIEVTDYGDYGDYTSKWENLGKGIWENNDYGSLSNYSTLKTNTQRDDYDYATLSKSPLPNVSEDELERETGAGPRGERSKFIPTDHGEVKSKYHYLGFGLWENTDPLSTTKQKKPSPPPVPPKAEPVWYNCTVAISTSLSSKELDDLYMNNFFENIPTRYLEIGDIFGNSNYVPNDLFNMFEKEDMSDMFKRAMYEKMSLTDGDKRKMYRCFLCENIIEHRVITAMARKYHPECFCCAYCRKEFKEKKFKTDPKDGTPYCFICFEKLLGHYGNAHRNQ